MPCLRNKNTCCAENIGGYKFRRQHILKPFIVDFYCADNKVVVEVDGPHHQKPSRRRYDERRDHILRQRYDVHILRFDVRRMYENVDKVLAEILDL
ncbi:endonuclease domain-containing protein [Bradymonas sediminis]|uniref:DUF559 domain-containing protein n=1 Tax=Bradymonas sediminis TaxID=1548548 RepID=A0A2Z4FN64_9DELT|nr:hypothetical protein DN745_12645 [Bradymonas sediminis]